MTLIVFITYFIHLTNLDIYKIIHVNTLYPQASSQTCCCGYCHIHDKADPLSLGGAGLGRNRGGNEPWLCLHMAGHSPVGSAPLGYSGRPLLVCLGYKWTVKLLSQKPSLVYLLIAASSPSQHSFGTHNYKCKNNDEPKYKKKMYEYQQDTQTCKKDDALRGLLISND